MVYYHPQKFLSKEALSFLPCAGKLGQMQVADPARLICVVTINRDQFLPDPMELLGMLIEAGMNPDWLALEGSHLLECVRVNDLGLCTRTWRLVARSATTKAAMMQQCHLIGNRLTTLGLKVSDWTWNVSK